jgi:parallel beta-helix repeat protein
MAGIGEVPAALLFILGETMSFNFSNNWPYSSTLFPSMDDHIDPVNHDYFTELHTEIQRIEYYLGLQPQGAYYNIAARLDYMTSNAGKRSCTVIVAPTLDNGDYTDIQQAIDYVNGLGGGLVYIREGTYLLTSAITMTSYSDIIIRGSGNKTVIKSNVSLANMIAIGNNSVRSSFIVIRDICFDGAPAYSGGTGLIEANGCDNLTIYNCNFINSDNRGIRLLNADHLIITQCKFLNNGYNDIAQEGTCSHSIISHNHFEGKNSNTYAISSSGNFTKIHGNSIYNYKYGIYVDGVNKSIIENTIYLCSKEGITLDSVSRSIVANNIISYCSTVGIYAFTCESVTITGNHVSFCSLNGMLFYGMLACVISSNVCHHNSQNPSGNFEIFFHPIGLRGNTYNSILGNSLACGGTSNGMGQFDNINDHNSIVGNTCSGFAAYGITTGGTYNDFGHNVQ